MTRRFHIALSVQDVAASVAEYSQRLGCKPEVVVAQEYALWRTAQLNFSIRQTAEAAGSLRHVGWEDDAADGFSKDSDVNGLVWEQFSPQAQREEITRLWPRAIA